MGMEPGGGRAETGEDSVSSLQRTAERLADGAETLRFQKADGTVCRLSAMLCVRILVGTWPLSGWPRLRMSQAPVLRWPDALHLEVRSQFYSFPTADEQFVTLPRGLPAKPLASGRPVIEET